MSVKLITGINLNDITGIPIHVAIVRETSNIRIFFNPEEGQVSLVLVKNKVTLGYSKRLYKSLDKTPLTFTFRSEISTLDNCRMQNNPT